MPQKGGLPAYTNSGNPAPRFMQLGWQKAGPRHRLLTPFIAGAHGVGPYDRNVARCGAPSAGFGLACRRAARGGQEQAVVRVAEDRLAAQRRDDLLSQGITGEVDQFILKYPGRDKLSQRR